MRTAQQIVCYVLMTNLLVRLAPQDLLYNHQPILVLVLPVINHLIGIQAVIAVNFVQLHLHPVLFVKILQFVYNAWPVTLSISMDNVSFINNVNPDTIITSHKECVFPAL